MALMERKREKKGKSSEAKPAAQPAPEGHEHEPGDDSRPADLEEPPVMATTPKPAKRRAMPLVQAATTAYHEEKSFPKEEILAAIEKAPATTAAAAAAPATMAPPVQAEPAPETEPSQEPSTTPGSQNEIPRGKTLIQLAADAEAVEEEGNIAGDELSTTDYDELTDMEKDVLRVAKASMKKKRYEADIGFEPYTPMVEKVLNDCLAKFHVQKGYSKESIIDTIKGLVDQKWIVTAERRTKDEIIASELYQDITRFLVQYPGTHARDDRIQTKLGITRNPFLKHILVLERFDLIQKRKFGKLWNFFAPSFKEDDKVAELVVVLYNDIVRQLVQLLLKNPGSTLVDLAKRIIPPVYHGAIQYHLKKLEEIGLVMPDGANRNIVVSMLARYNDVVCDELKFNIAT
nr:hypothetical protein [Candidatus Sigynarchaeota archaeon]